MKKQQNRKDRSKKLRLSRETVRKLDLKALQEVRGGDGTFVPGISKCTCR